MTFATAVATPGRLSRSPCRGAGDVGLWNDGITLATGRVHELCGAARRTLALHIAAAAGAPVIWIAPAHAPVVLNADGIAALAAPQSILFVSAERETDMLWAMEEALRSGAVSTVIADLAAAPAMTPVRRLHLAAETGASAGHCKPLGLLLTPGAGGAQGIETRWQMDPTHAPGQNRWTLIRSRARMAPPARWQVDADRLVPQPGQA